MRISKIQLYVFFIFMFFILIETISIASYKTAVLGQMDVQNSYVELVEQEQVFLNKEEQDVINLINEFRKRNGLKELKAFSKLQEVARIKAEDLVKNEYFAHTSPILGTPFEMLKQNDIEYAIAGENLAGNTTAKKAVIAWLNSPSHRDNILEEKFEYTGICVINSPVYGKIYVQLFMGV